jgi:KipI family sensor histidine kinase inhibitor
MSSAPVVYILSNNSLLLDASHLEADNILAIQKKIWALTKHCKTSGEFTDLVPGMNSLTCYLKCEHALNKWQHALPLLWSETQSTSFTGQHHLIHTHYNGEDLNYVAHYHNLSTDEVISIHSKAHYHVLFLGFQPGFAYLYGLDTRLHTPRRDEPRTTVPKGSVGIGAGQTGIYPADTPGGWHIIGHTQTSLFDSTQSQPCLIQPGDTLAFAVLKNDESHL